MFGAILKVANSSFQKGMTFLMSIYILCFIVKILRKIMYTLVHPSFAV